MTIGPDHYNDIFAESIILRSPNTGAPRRGAGDSSIRAAAAREAAAAGLGSADY